MSGPVRIQRKRTAGWHMPENTVYVGRPGKWGNPHTVAHHGEQGALRAFVRDLHAGVLDFSIEDVQRELRGKNLACWCPHYKPCHATVLLELANARSDEERGS